MRFKELHEEFCEAGVEVIGASVDTAELNEEFGAKEKLPFSLASDPSRRLASELGILKDGGDRGLIASRVTYLLDGHGTIIRFWQIGTGDAIEAHPYDVLAAIRAT